jgi:hypothetical protein
MTVTESVSLDRRLHASRPDLADARLVGRVEAARFVEAQPARVAVPLADLRRQPASGAPLETQALFGEAVGIFEETDEGWCWVQLAGDGYVGWMPTAALVRDATRSAPTHRVSALRTFVFPGPDVKLPPLHDLPMGAVVFATGEASDPNADYVLVEPFGAVVRQHLCGVSEAADDFVAVAERFVGVPYLWGGKSALGIDCSGLVQVALAQAGISAPRDSDLQAAQCGRALQADEPLMRGDLVFWRGHVGIMLDAERLLHANVHHMMTAVEPLLQAVTRSVARGSSVTMRRRLER